MIFVGLIKARMSLTHYAGIRVGVLASGHPLSARPQLGRITPNFSAHLID